MKDSDHLSNIRSQYASKISPVKILCYMLYVIMYNYYLAEEEVGNDLHITYTYLNILLLVTMSCVDITIFVIELYMCS